MTRENKYYLIFLLLIILSAVIFFLQSDGCLSLSLEMPMQATGGSVTIADGAVARVVSSECSDGLMTVILAPVGRGSTLAHVNWEPADNVELNIYDLDLRLSVMFTGGLIERVSGNFTGWHFVSACLTLFFLASAFTLLRLFVRRRDELLFSYRTVLCAGLGIYVLIVALFCLSFTVKTLVDPSMTMWLLYLLIVTACQDFVICTAPLLAVFAAALFISNLALVCHEGFCRGNMFGFIVSVLMLAGIIGGGVLFFSTVNFSMRNAVSNIYSSLFCYLECMLFAVMVCTLTAAKHNPSPDRDYILILGCKIRDDGSLYPMLQGRVDRALEFAAYQQRTAGKEAVFVPSGGKGTDEVISEAEAMARYLRQKGIPDERILIEKQSTNTWENMCCSKKLIEERNANAKVAFSTTNFHVFRSGILAQDAGWSPDGMGCPTKWYFWPNAFIREFIGLLASKFWVHLAVMLFIALIFTSMTLLF